MNRPVFGIALAAIMVVSACSRYCPNSVTHTGDGAFRGNPLTGVISGGVTAIQDMVFVGGAVAYYVTVIDAPIQDEAARTGIVTRINEEGVRANVTSAGIIQVADEATARRIRTIFILEDLIPRNIDPWAIFDRDRWTITDFERDINRQRTQTQMITDHIRTVDGVDNANVTIVWPRQELFRPDQNPVTASVILTPEPDSNISRNRHVIEGIQRLLQLAVEGLITDNIVITDHTGVILNDFAWLAAPDT